MDALIASQIIKIGKQRTKHEGRILKKKEKKAVAVNKPKALSKRPSSIPVDDIDLNLELLFNGPDPVAKAMEAANIGPDIIPEPETPSSDEATTNEQASTSKGNLYKAITYEIIFHFCSDFDTVNISLSLQNPREHIDPELSHRHPTPPPSHPQNLREHIDPELFHRHLPPPPSHLPSLPPASRHPQPANQTPGDPRHLQPVSPNYNHFKNNTYQ